jgi:regulator of protease activity HflC (stomatin/prohibitin superfamily)
MIIDVKTNERALLHVNGRPTRYVGPGRYWSLRPFSRVEVVRFPVDGVVADVRPEQAPLFPATDLKAVTVAPHERGLVVSRGRPVRWLQPGQYHLFTVDKTVEVRLVDTRPLEATPLDPQTRALVPADDYVETTVPEGAVALRYVDGVLEAVLPPGRHACFTTTRKVTLATLDQRERVLAVNGQEVMTRDRVTLRLNLAVVFRVADPRLMATAATNVDEVLYLSTQAAAREAVASRTLDALLAARTEVAAELRDPVAARATELGLLVSSVVLKDLVLPGDMKALLNKVVEAQKNAEANVITRREETAATRSQAQTAKLLDEHPLLIRLKELEAYWDLAGKVGMVHLVLGEEGLKKLELRTDATLTSPPSRP